MELAAAMVENLATQFKSALDFYRELVQNSIDAGSPRIDVWLEYQPGEGGEGAIVIHVDDFGDGMNEAIIDNELTQLFASSKDNDLTKIGKFGIGFVSVFALRPKAVMVTTGRAGEYWQVIFGEDRSFVKTRIDEPVEGTQVALFLAGDYQRYTTLSRDSLASLKKWCVHSETEITFEDRSSELRGARPELITINEPFGVTGRFATTYEEPGTVIAVAFSPEPEWGFYNRGLTLLQTGVYEEAFPAEHREELGIVSLKLKSRFLEHTLTRETVLRDENYEKALARVLAVVRGELREAVIASMEEVAALPSLEIADLADYAIAAGFVSRWPAKVYEEWADRKILRQHGGAPLSLREVTESAWTRGRVCLSERFDESVRLLTEGGERVVFSFAPNASSLPAAGADGAPLLAPVYRILVNWMQHVERKPATFRGWGAIAREVSDYAGAIVKGLGAWDFSTLDSESWSRRRALSSFAAADRVLIRVEHEALSTEAAALIQGAGAVLERADAGYGTLEACSISGGSTPLFVLAQKFEDSMLLPPDHSLPGRRPDVAVNIRHPHFEHALSLHAAHPALALYILSKALLLKEDRLLGLDPSLLSAALSAGGAE
ncbi:MAG: hypothetical protein ACJAYU_000190 [Bradymonadia bacterium]|jgi:hypothetical protein